MDFSQTSEQGAFNQGLAYLERLDKIIKSIDIASFDSNYEEKYKLLFIFYREMYPMMNKKDRESHNEMAWVVREKFKLYLEAKRKNFNKVDVVSIEVLDMWEIELRDLMQKKGLLMPKKDDPRYALK